jgi:hypothetical protein
VADFLPAGTAHPYVLRRNFTLADPHAATEVHRDNFSLPGSGGVMYGIELPSR